MAAYNSVPASVTAGAGTPTTQPASPGVWINGGALTFWDGGANRVIDFNQGPNTSVFGSSLGDV